MINTLTGRQGHFDLILIEDLFINQSQKFTGPFQNIQIANLDQIRSHPTSCLENLVLNDPLSLAHELKVLPKCLILAQNREIEKLRHLQQLNP